MTRSRFAVLGLAAASLFAASGVRAADCRTIPSVLQSGVLANNTGMGGHVTGHVYGQVPPAGWNYTNKTLFTSGQEYTGAWRNFVAAEPSGKFGVNCSGNNPVVRVLVEALLKKPTIGGYSCHNATCTDKNRVKAKRITFAFVLNGDNQWILTTAFPSPGN